MLVRCLLVAFSRQADVGVYCMPMEMQVRPFVAMFNCNHLILAQDKTLFPLKTMDGLMLQVQSPVPFAAHAKLPVA
jgi:hypothetical protein